MKILDEFINVKQRCLDNDIPPHQAEEVKVRIQEWRYFLFENRLIDEKGDVR